MWVVLVVAVVGVVGIIGVLIAGRREPHREAAAPELAQDQDGQNERQPSQEQITAYAALYRELSAWYAIYARHTDGTHFNSDLLKEPASAAKELVSTVALYASRDVLDILMPIVTTLLEANGLKYRGARSERTGEVVEPVAKQLPRLLGALRRDLGRDSVELALPVLEWD